jgi:hypothetical protein
MRASAVGAVLVAAWYGGLGPGLLAIAFSTLAAVYFFLPPAAERGGRPQLRAQHHCCVAGTPGAITVSVVDIEGRSTVADNHSSDRHGGGASKS